MPKKVQLPNRRALLLMSGGPDSTTLARVAQQEGPGLAAAVYLRTGSKTDAKEIAAAKREAARLKIPFEIMDIGDVVQKLGVLRIMPHASAHIAEFGLVLSLSVAIAYANTIEVGCVLIALHADDTRLNSQYSQLFLDQVNKLASMTGSPQVFAPFLDLTKAEVFELGKEIGVNYSETWSCSENGETHCGWCGGCKGRQSALIEAGIIDETLYLNKVTEALAAVG